MVVTTRMPRSRRIRPIVEPISPANRMPMVGRDAADPKSLPGTLSCSSARAQRRHATACRTTRSGIHAGVAKDLVDPLIRELAPCDGRLVVGLGGRTGSQAIEHVGGQSAGRSRLHWGRPLRRRRGAQRSRRLTRDNSPRLAHGEGVPIGVTPRAKTGKSPRRRMAGRSPIRPSTTNPAMPRWRAFVEMRSPSTGRQGRATRIDDNDVAGPSDVQALVDHQVVAREDLHRACRPEDAQGRVVRGLISSDIVESRFIRSEIAGVSKAGARPRCRIDPLCVLASPKSGTRVELRGLRLGRAGDHAIPSGSSVRHADPFLQPL